MDTNPPPTNSTSPWFGRILIALLCAQLGLTWVQGRLLHQQNQDLQGLRGEIRDLSEILEQTVIENGNESGVDEAPLSPARQRRASGHAWVRAGHISIQDDGADQAAKDSQASRESAQKAVKHSREVQGKLSFEENARKAEEKAKAQGIQNAGMKWFLVALGAGLAAFVVRSWLRRRG
ncbi:MAG: hypothetical protein Q8O00_13400 [Holophaga sp.]|nr:hypothetical protein [Holophaga sp.]